MPSLIKVGAGDGGGLYTDTNSKVISYFYIYFLKIRSRLKTECMLVMSA
jgi:hypothetical protein